VSADSLDILLRQLTAGEAEAAEKVFQTYAPYLRVLVRRRLTPPLRAKFDSMDIVQSVWADVLEGFREGGWQFSDRDHLRAFLAKVTYNHFISHCRKHTTALERERPMPEDGRLDAAASPQPRPSQLAQADELWQTMMRLCPPAHHELLRLKRQGFSLAEIAARTGLHESSVRRILYDLARRLAATREKDERENGLAG
jgi:RNA polymerase sigma-70 factor (ECF subfamily)